MFRPRSLILSCAAVRSRRIRYSGSSLRPLRPRVSFWVRRRRSSSRWLAKRMTWKGSATCTAFGNTLSYAFRYEPDMSSTAQRIPPSQSAGCDRNQAAALSAVLPATMSISWWPPTSTTEVHHCLVRHLPRRQNRGCLIMCAKSAGCTWGYRRKWDCGLRRSPRPFPRPDEPTPRSTTESPAAPVAGGTSVTTETSVRSATGAVVPTTTPRSADHNQNPTTPTTTRPHHNKTPPLEQTRHNKHHQTISRPGPTLVAIPTGARDRASSSSNNARPGRLR